MEEIEIINLAIQSGDTEAWKHLYTRFNNAVKNILFKGGFRDQDVEDLAHQTFVKILNAKKKPSFINERYFYAWLIRTVKTVIYDFSKSKSTTDENQTDYFEDMDILTIDVSKEEVSNNLIESKINNALKKLSEKEQMLLSMRINKTSYDIIAKETGIPVNNIRMYYKRAVEKLRKYINDEGMTL